MWQLFLSFISYDALMRNVLERVLSFVIHYVAGSLFYDGVHALAHMRGGSRFRPLRLLARAHAAHHQWFGRKLTIDDKFLRKSLLLHLPMELACQMVGAALSWILLILTAWRGDLQDLLTIWAIQMYRTSVVAWNAGRDSNHLTFSHPPKDAWSFFVGPEYHALHHIDHQNFFGSAVRMIDWVLDTATTLQGRHVTITGASGALGGAFVNTLKGQVKSIRTLPHEGGWSLEVHPEIETVLRETDILILSHGTKGADTAMDANCNAAVALIESFRKVRCGRESHVEILPEVWYIGSEAEVHGSWTASMDAYVDSKRAYAAFARAYYNAGDFNYRHIVPAAFSSRMGPGLVSARWVAEWALWSIRRGARYVPVTYTGFAFLGYFRFNYLTTPRRCMDKPYSQKLNACSTSAAS
ncbi:hypothetical protein ACHAQA_010104 [Verticillium albo-atrum]